MRTELAVILSSLLINSGTAIGQLAEEHVFDELVIRSTFKLQSGNSLGTGFILLQPVKTLTNVHSYVLVTAAHVFSGMASDNVTLIARADAAGEQKRISYEIRIREKGTNLWTQHPEADIAALRIPFSSDFELGMLTTEMLREDDFFERFHIHPGDEVRVIGYPFGYEANNVGYPVLRSGRIASFPLTPSAKVKTFLLDFQVFRGNSGGPVYISERRAMRARDQETVSIRGLLGLISQEATLAEAVKSLDEESVKRHQLGLGIVVHARFIRETIELLPSAVP